MKLANRRRKERTYAPVIGRSPFGWSGGGGVVRDSTREGGRPGSSYYRNGGKRSRGPHPMSDQRTIPAKKNLTMSTRPKRPDGHTESLSKSWHSFGGICALAAITRAIIKEE